MAPRELIAAADWEEITRRSAAAVELLNGERRRMSRTPRVITFGEALGVLRTDQTGTLAQLCT